MNEQVLRSNAAKRAIAYCCAMTGDCSEAQAQESELRTYAESNGMRIFVTHHASVRMESFTYRDLRLRAKYREFDVLLISELDALGNSPIEITHEINFLNENGVKVVSVKEGELNAETLPQIFRGKFRLVSHSC